MRAEELGLKGKDFRAYVEKALDDAFDENYRATNSAALYEAQVRTFSQPLLPHTLGNTLQNAVSTHPSLRAIFPFVRTPINVFRYAIKTLPGLNLLQREYREMIAGKRGPELQANAYGQMVVGSLPSPSPGRSRRTADHRRGPEGARATPSPGGHGMEALQLRHGEQGRLAHLRAVQSLRPAGAGLGIAADITELGLTETDAR